MSARTSFAFSAIVCWVALFAVSSAQAVPTLKLSDGVTTVTVTDQLAGDGAIGTPGFVQFNNFIGSWIVNVTTGISDPVQGSPALPFMTLNSVNMSVQGRGTLFIWFSDDFFGPTLANYTTYVGGILAGPAGNSLSYDAFADPGNTLFAETIPLSTPGSFSPGAFAGSKDGLLDLPANYSLTQRVVITHLSSGTTSFQADLYTAPIPEPATATLGLLSIGGLMLRRRRMA